LSSGLSTRPQREIGIDRADLRRRNTVPASAMPIKTNLVYTSRARSSARALKTHSG